MDQIATTHAHAHTHTHIRTGTHAHTLATKIFAGDDIVLDGDTPVCKMPRSICRFLSNDGLRIRAQA